MDIAQHITDRIIAELEQGTAPWVKPWHENSEAYNPVSGTVYRGMNQLWLGMAGLGKSNAWLTFKQLSELGFRAKKGTGVPIIFWKQLSITKKDANGEDVNATIPMLKCFYVFNASDIDGASFSKGSGSNGLLDRYQSSRRANATSRMMQLISHW